MKLERNVLDFITAVKHLRGQHDQSSHGNRFGHVEGLGKVQVRVGGGPPGRNVEKWNANGTPKVVEGKKPGSSKPVTAKPASGPQNKPKPSSTPQEKPKPEKKPQEKPESKPSKKPETKPSANPKIVETTKNPDNNKKPIEMVKGIEDHLNEKYPYTQFDFQDMHPDIAREVADQIDRLYADHPEVSKTLKYVGTANGLPKDHYIRKNWAKSAKNNPYAVANRYDGISTIVLNPKFYGNKKLFQKSLDNDVKLEWHPPGTNSAAGLLTHEFGHVYDNHFKMNGTDKSIFDWKDSKNIVNSNFLLQRFKQDNTGLGQKVSGYAKKAGTVEEFAEGFAALYHTPEAKMPEYSKKLKKIMPVISPKNWKTPTKRAGDLGLIPETTDAEKAQAEWKKFYRDYIAN